ncbi:NnrS family protein [Herbaspirillum sp. AP02]|uniref:NnrS family protein n=1 Tax=unclassified Herbaspirillum TaxID=2624150 RepID=UPI0015DAC62D|nr:MULTISPECIES: NnrS family protein [unclassified Herbaspirillum]MBG7621185.1 NnrS family protein [Herbaspirillum sp. AP02]NZD68914.1 NnrS family protein [Herbaspirillum sp. AP21]
MIQISVRSSTSTSSKPGPADTPPALFSLGFRPFFLAGSLWAALCMVLWIGILHGHLVLPTHFDALNWHIHEMLFGWIMAAIAGFLLTAIPNWTGRAPLRGGVLAILAGLWLLGRVVGTVSALLPLWLAALAELLFPLALCTVAWRDIIAARNRRNLPMPMPVALLAVADLLMYLRAGGVDLPPGLDWRLALVAVCILMSVIGARIIPAFTRNWLTARRSPVQVNSDRWLDIAATASLHATLLAWACLPRASAVGGLLLVAATLNLARLARWRGDATLAEPLLAVLHLGYLWLIAGVSLLGLSLLGLPMLEIGAIHALTAGAMGSMVLGVMTRVSLGHTGRALRADRSTVAIYASISAAAGCRIAATFFSSNWLLSLSALCWTLAFLLFVLRYAAVLSQPRVA